METANSGLHGVTLCKFIWRPRLQETDQRDSVGVTLQCVYPNDDEEEENTFSHLRLVVLGQVVVGLFVQILTFWGFCLHPNPMSCDAYIPMHSGVFLKRLFSETISELDSTTARSVDNPGQREHLFLKTHWGGSHKYFALDSFITSSESKSNRFKKKNGQSQHSRGWDIQFFSTLYRSRYNNAGSYTSNIAIYNFAIYTLDFTW